MLKIYEINEQVENLSMNLVDEETGEYDELIEQAIIEKLNEKPALLEHYALIVKTNAQRVAAIDAEIKRLNKIKKHCNSVSDFFSTVIDSELKGQKWETEKVKCTYRKSTLLKIDMPEDVFVDYLKGEGREDLVNVKVIEKPNKTKIKDLIKKGEVIDYCEIEERKNLSIK